MGLTGRTAEKRAFGVVGQGVSIDRHIFHGDPWSVYGSEEVFATQSCFVAPVAPQVEVCRHFAVATHCRACARLSRMPMQSSKHWRKKKARLRGSRGPYQQEHATYCTIYNMYEGPVAATSAWVQMWWQTSFVIMFQ